MTILPLDPSAHRNPADLKSFLRDCQKLALRRGRPVLVSISLEVAPLDPLAVLESIFEPGERHFYAEKATQGLAVAGAEAAVVFAASGPGRFLECQRFVDQTLEDAVCVGPQDAPFAGPHFFLAATFAPEALPDEPFEPASLFVPRWQVGREGERTAAVANALLGPEDPIDPLAERIWRAHAKFKAFDYRAPKFGPAPPARFRLSEAGDYAGSVRQALRAISRGDFEKIVLARAKDLKASAPFHPLRALNDLRQRFPDCYAFSVANGRGQSFIGATPELLLRAGGGWLESEALAGSTGRGATASQDAGLGSALLRSEKDLHEHRLVTEAVLQTFQQAGLEPLHPEAPTLRRLANVQHLHTPIRARVGEQFPSLAILEQLHPTPAVGGEPRAAALAAIPHFESFPRGLYAGALGWFRHQGRAECFVGLRSALIDGPRARLYAGAGIVAESSPKEELAETELKFRPMEEALGFVGKAAS